MDHHYRLAVGRLRRDFDARSLEVFDELLVGRTVEEIARRHEMSEQAVHKVKQRIRERLSLVIGEQILDEEGVGGGGG